MKIDKKPLIREIKKIIKEFLTKYKVSSDENLHEKFDIIINKDATLTIKAPSYILFADTGRKPGNPPPVNDILKWLKTEKISKKRDHSTLQQLAFAISRNIGKNGFKGKKFMEPMLNEINQYYNNNILNYIQYE